MTNIREARKKVGMTQIELADACGVSNVMIHHVEIGRKIPNAYLLRDIAHALGVTMEELVDDATGD